MKTEKKKIKNQNDANKPDTTDTTLTIDFEEENKSENKSIKWESKVNGI
jgi:hypothetical protein